MTTILNLVALFVLSSIALATRVAQRKFDSKTAEVVGLVSVSAVCLYIQTIKLIVLASYASYRAGRTVRRWWDSRNPSRSHAGVNIALEEQKLLGYFAPVGLLPPTATTTATTVDSGAPAANIALEEQKLLGYFAPVGLLPPTATASGDKLTTELFQLTVGELKKLAKSKGLRGYSRLRKAELVNLLTKQQV